MALQTGKSARGRVERLDWDLVRVFLAVAREGRLSRAAERLKMDVSTVSRRVTRLEKSLGVPLFERSRDGVLATAAGEKLVPAAEDMARAMGELGVAFDAVEAEAEGVVRLTAPPDLAEAFIAPALARFCARYPKVRLELDASVEYADLTRREADLALRVRRPEGGDLVARKLVSWTAVPATSASYAAQLGTVRRLNEARWITWGHDLAQLPEARWISTHVPVPPVLRTSSFAAQIAAARAGLGVAVIPPPYLAKAELVPVKRSPFLAAAWNALPGGELWLVGHAALRRVPRVSALWDFLVEELA